MANRKPYNIDFCRAVVASPEYCSNLKNNDRCKLDECVYNHKQVVYWETHGEFPPNGEE